MPQLTVPVLAAGVLSAIEQPTIERNGLFLRPWETGDADTLVSAYADLEIQRWHTRSLTAPEAAEWVTSRHAAWSSDAGADWAVVTEQAVVGRVSLKDVDLAEGHAEVGYWVLPAARRRRIATTALRVMSDWALHEGGFHRLEPTHSTNNPASCGVAARAGYTVEGTKRQHALHADGWHDMHLHARLRDDAR